MPDAHLLRACPDAPRDTASRTRRLVVLLALALLAATMVFPSLMQAAAGPKVVVIVGPVGRYNTYYKNEARELIAEARKHTSNVVVLFTPKATWARVKEQTKGASILVYFGHGWGYPSQVRTLRPGPPERHGARSLVRRRRHAPRLLRREPRPGVDPPGAGSRGAAVPAVLRVRQHRARPVRGDDLAVQAPRGRLRRGLPGHRRADRDRGRPPEPPRGTTSSSCSSRTARCGRCSRRRRTTTVT